MQNPLLASRAHKPTLSGLVSGGSGDESLSELRLIQRQLSYPHRISVYHQPPPVEITIEDFESYALDRLQILKALESAMLRNRSEEQLRKLVNELQKKFIPLSPSQSHRLNVDVDAERRKDHISHYILRLAYCKSEDLRVWLVRHESILFRIRWEMFTKEERQTFLESSNFHFESISQQEKLAMTEMLKSGTPVLQKLGVTFEKENFFKVPFECVPDLVGHRDVYLSEGWAYVPQSCLISVVIAEYKTRLMESLESLAKSLPRIDDDDRLKPILNNMSRQYLGKEFSAVNAALNGKISHDDIDKVSAHFAPCMRHLYSQLKRNNHLKHMGRMQFGLFLKGIGLSMEEALIFWRKSFSKLTDDQYQKGGYAYNIRHNYGQEGKRTNYTPFSCVKIITTNAPSHGDNHGCPFKHFSRDNLHQMLLSHRVDPVACNDIVDLAKGGHIQVACTKYFEVTRGKFNPHTYKPDANDETGQHNIMDTITHPNQFFELSMQAAGIGKSDGEVKIEQQ